MLFHSKKIAPNFINISLSNLLYTTFLYIFAIFFIKNSAPSYHKNEWNNYSLKSVLTKIKFNIIAFMNGGTDKEGDRENVIFCSKLPF